MMMLLLDPSRCTIAFHNQPGQKKNGQESSTIRFENASAIITSSSVRPKLFPVSPSSCCFSSTRSNEAAPPGNITRTSTGPVRVRTHKFDFHLHTTISQSKFANFFSIAVWFGRKFFKTHAPCFSSIFRFALALHFGVSFTSRCPSVRRPKAHHKTRGSLRCSFARWAGGSQQNFTTRTLFPTESLVRLFRLWLADWSCLLLRARCGSRRFIHAAESWGDLVLLQKESFVAL